ncbi:MAG: hypothetical protein OEO82_13500 [Gammaproteobacteria bacterium]|nr:hypothetical protein [Gammaproteobacteria bacterium]
MLFNNLTIAATEENQPGIFTIDSGNTITVTGGFDLACVGIPNWSRAGVPAWRYELPSLPTLPAQSRMTSPDIP